MIVRIGTIEAVEAEDDITVVGELAAGEQIIEAYERTRPNLILMDCRLNGIGGTETTEKLLAKHPDVPILFLSVYDGEEDIGRAVAAGAQGYLSKNAETIELLDAIRTVAGGGEYFPAKIIQKLKTQQNRKALSVREMEVLRLLVDGQSNKEIVENLHISMPTVKLHVSNLLMKLEVADRTQAVLAAVRRGIVHLDD